MSKECSKGDDCVHEGGPLQPLANFHTGQNRCKSCTQIYHRARYTRANNPRSSDPKKCSNKTCPHDGRLQPATAFGSHKGASDGLKTVCKSCSKDAVYKTMTKSPRAFVKHIFLVAKNRCLKKTGVRFDMSLDDWYDLYDAQSGKCALTGFEMTFTLDETHPSTVPGVTRLKWPFNISPDQIHAGQGYVRGNVQLVCSFVNAMKGEMPTQELLRFAKALVDNHQHGMRAIEGQ